MTNHQQISDIMPIETIPDWEKRIARQDAFWENEIIDRPVVCMGIPVNNPDYPYPKEKSFSSLKERWLDPEFVAEKTLHGVMNTEFLGDALPGIFPNLGPEVFSAYFGMEMEYGETTSWSIPNLPSWDLVDKVKFSEENFYWKKTIEITDALLEIGKNKFYTGFTDLHPGGDALTAFRDPVNLNLDMIEAVDKVKRLLDYTNKIYFQVYDFFYEKFSRHHQAITTWPGIVSSKKWYVPSNDFSCMISKEMFDDVFLPGIIKECQHMEASIYHLDGPGALQHLDSLLEIKELNAIQWVYGSGNGIAVDWIHIHKKCQDAGKGLQIHTEKEFIDVFMEQLKPEGIWLSVTNIENHDQAETVLKKISGWKS